MFAVKAVLSLRLTNLRQTDCWCHSDCYTTHIWIFAFLCEFVDFGTPWRAAANAFRKKAM